VLVLDSLVGHCLVCPRCRALIAHTGDEWRCTEPSCAFAGTPFPVVAGEPALVDFDHSVLDAGRLRAVDGASEVTRSRYAAPLRRLVHPANTTAPVQVARMVELLRRDRAVPIPRVLVIGGGTIGDGLAWLYVDESVDVLSFDVYASPSTQFVADGHALPLADGSMDGVVVQAVLEHVLEPSVVAGEIHRVLRVGGIVYADTPFLQQVHEGPYDFTRFTDSGHRYLFRSFERIDSGTVAGAGTALRWSVDYFVRALTRSVPLGRIAALALFWLSHLDRFLDPRHSSDGASSVFFLGRKAEAEIGPAEIIDYYPGGM
jgi:SAM-dependent methyltransferase